MFLASGGNWMNSTVPIAQKKLMAQMARKTRRSFIVVRTSVTDERITW